MRKLCAISATTLLLASCGDTPAAVMPDVKGERLDVAKATIERGGIDSDPEVVGGGAFGVVVDGNWEVCEQSPPAGKRVLGAPRLSVKRNCADAKATPTRTPRATRAPKPEAKRVLTPANSSALAALFAVRDYCDKSVEAFAKRYDERTIEFNGSIVDMAHHGDYTTRWDFLVAPGGKGPQSTTGPALKFSDLHPLDFKFVGRDAPSRIGVGDRFRFTATVDEYNPNQCILFLQPVATRAR